MNKVLLGILVLGSFSAFAQDCSVSLYRLKSSNKAITSILESKGYVVANQDTRFSIQRARYFGPRGETIIVINMFEKGHEGRVGHVEKNLSFFSNAKKMEKDFLKSLPECK